MAESLNSPEKKQANYNFHLIAFIPVLPIFRKRIDYILDLLNHYGSVDYNTIDSIVIKLNYDPEYPLSDEGFPNWYISSPAKSHGEEQNANYARSRT